MLLTTGAALLLAAVALLGYDVREHRRAFVEDLRAQADIVALLATPALSFGDRDSALLGVQSLRAVPSLAAAALYVDGERYAEYSRPGEPAPPLRLTAPEGVVVQGGDVTLVRAVEQNGERLGYVWLRAHDALARRVQTYASILATVLLLSLGAAALLSRRLYASIAGPLESMAAVARAVVERRDFGARAPRGADDEIGVVVDAFNAMLDEIDVRTRALTESERLYRAIGESIDYGVWVADRDGRCLYVSDSFLRLLGLTLEQCAENGWIDRLHPDERDETMAAWAECARAGQPWYRECRVLGGDGAWHPILAQGVPVRDETGAIVRWAGINLDIERMKRTEDALRDADRRKDEFLATLAHELRNPLAPIRHAARVLDSPAADARHLRWAREVIARQVGRMALLLDDLLDVSRITRGLLTLRRAPVDLATVVAAAVETAQPLIEAKRHVLDVRLPREPLALDVDPLRLSQAISNLLTNAAKYTDAGGRLAIAVDAAGEGLRIDVSDNGIGFAPETGPRLFEMFSQVESARDRAEGGLGIGLALVRGLVALHGGTVSAVSDGPGRGSTFTIRLPASAVWMHGRPEPARADDDAPVAVAARVLVADDNRDAADALAAVVRLRGHDVRTAYGGAEALERAEAWRPDVVVLDVGMPDLGGLQIAREIRRRSWGRGVRLLAVTGWGQEEDKRESQRAGFDHHLTKPVDPDELGRWIGGTPTAEVARASPC